MFFIVLFVFSNVIFGQTDCNLVKEISVESFNKLKLNGGSNFFKIKKDSLFESLSLRGNFKKVTVFKSDDCSKLVVKSVLNNSGIYQPSDSQIDQGYCFCENCIIGLSKIKLSTDESVLIKVEGGSFIEASLVSVKKKISNEWYDKTYNKGDRIKLTNIMFIAGLSRFQTASFKDLNLLFQLLKTDIDLKIEIQGHVNGPKLKNKKEFQLLSENRAKAVLDFLVKKGIKKSRLKSFGYGNSKMIFPNATTEFKMQFNRRVEILVL